MLLDYTFLEADRFISNSAHIESANTIDTNTANNSASVTVLVTPYEPNNYPGEANPFPVNGLQLPVLSYDDRCGLGSILRRQQLRL